MPIFTTKGGADPKVMATIESVSLRHFFFTFQSLIRHMVMDILSAVQILEQEEEQLEEEEEEEEYITTLSFW